MESSEAVAEKNQSLWTLTVAPCVWGLHFLVCYIGAALWCGKFGEPTKGLGGLHVTLIVLTVLALFAIAVAGWGGWRRHSHGKEAEPHDQDTPEDRHRFLGLATVLLSALSAVATIFTSIAVLTFQNCY